MQSCPPGMPDFNVMGGGERRGGNDVPVLALIYEYTSIINILLCMMLLISSSYGGGDISGFLPPLLNGTLWDSSQF